MSNEPENPNAFACVSEYFQQEGMTLRDYFAGQALMSLAGRPVSEGSQVTADMYQVTVVEYRASLAYQFADAMLEARAK